MEKKIDIDLPLFGGRSTIKSGKSGEFGVLISCIILMGDVFTIHVKVRMLIKKTIFALNNYLMPL